MNLFQDLNDAKDMKLKKKQDEEAANSQDQLFVDPEKINIQPYEESKEFFEK